MENKEDGQSVRLCRRRGPDASGQLSSPMEKPRGNHLADDEIAGGAVLHIANHAARHWVHGEQLAKIDPKIAIDRKGSWTL